MISAEEFERRRVHLMETVKDDGVVLLLGHDHAAMNYPGNPYPFRQEPSFRYFFGLDEPGATGWLDLSTGEQRLYGHVPDLDSVVWEGKLPGLARRAEPFGDLTARPSRALESDLVVLPPGRRVHTLPPVRATSRERLKALLGHTEHSPELVRAVIAIREIKSEAEQAEISEAIDRSGDLHALAMSETRPGLHEYEVVRHLRARAAGEGWEWAYPIIFSVRGEVLHNPAHENVMKDGQLVVNDSGVSSTFGYASDITRSFPVGGRFSAEQRAVYEIVLSARDAALRAAGPGVPYRLAHDAAGRAITAGLRSLGLMRGDIDEAVTAGAHAAFMPHGVGHMLGLDVHDMEGLGEDDVGYDADHRRSTRFGLHNLRLGKPLRPGFVITVEPGIYLIPALLERWKEEGTHARFIDFDAALRWAEFGGIRIEDVITVTDDGVQVLGHSIPRTIDEVEEACGR